MDVSKEWKYEIKEFISYLNKYLGQEDLSYELVIANQNCKETFHKKYMRSKYQGDYSYRAVTLENHRLIYVFINEGETLDSIKWVITHELTHANLRENLFLKRILINSFNVTLKKYNIKTVDEYERELKNDVFHEDLLEEQICNRFATEVVGYNFDRIWWRQQLKNVA